MVSIDLGCGVNKPEGFIGLDNVTAADIRCDIGRGIPLKDASVDALRARDVLEHIWDMLSIFNECWRVLKPYGTLHIEVPRHPHADSVKDPTHVRFFVPETFTEYFCGPDRLEGEYGMKMWNGLRLDYDDRRIWTVLTPRGKE